MSRIVHFFSALSRVASKSGGAWGVLQRLRSIYRYDGVVGVCRRTAVAIARAPAAVGACRQDYAKWTRRYDTIDSAVREKILGEIATWDTRPLVSFVLPVQDSSLHALTEVVDSVRCQLYSNWELHIIDNAQTGGDVSQFLDRCAVSDVRIKLSRLANPADRAAATNAGLSAAEGVFVSIIDGCGILREYASYSVVRATREHPGAGLIYSDEDRLDDSGRRYDPHFKPDWNPDLFLSYNAIGRLAVYKASLVRDVGGVRDGFNGAQEYDLALRCIERLSPGEIIHIPRVLYHRRRQSGMRSEAENYNCGGATEGALALNDHFVRTGVDARAELLDSGVYRVRYATLQPAPMVSLIIPTRNGLALMRQCISSILEKTVYANYEIVIVDNNSDDPDTLAYFEALLENPRIRVIRDERPFNYSALNNAAVAMARGAYVGLLNNDIEVISPEWLGEMVGLAAQPGVGAVGARLWYPDDTLQHGGVITGILGLAAHAHHGLRRGERGYFCRASATQTLSAVTAACLVISKATYDEVGGLDEANLSVAYNDIDFCLRVREAGYRNVWTPYAELYHHESATRGYENTPEKRRRLEGEARYLRARWSGTLDNDPAYNPNLTLTRADYSLAWPPRVSPLGK